jgi:hypothetical protein
MSARQRQKVDLDAGEKAASNGSELRQTIQMRIAEMQDAIAIKWSRKVWKRYGLGHQLNIERIAPPATVQAQQPNSGVKRGQARRENPSPP